MLRIGLVNNMGDGALEDTDRQFSGLLASTGAAIELHRFRMPDIPRSARAAAWLEANCRDAADIPSAGLDALIVTGSEPRTPRLDQEAHWDAFRRLADWAARAGKPVIWSCLAAHAAVLHFDGVERRPLMRKCAGVFALDSGGFAPHSRQNGLEEADLTGAGYAIRSRAQGVGVDGFGRGSFLFLQGHPEYDAWTLKGEYQRDFKRFLRGERPAPPSLPANYFDAETEGRLAEFEMAARDRSVDENLALLTALLAEAAPEPVWRAGAEALYAGWIEAVGGSPALRRA